MHGGFGMGMGFGWMWIWPVVFLVVAVLVLRALGVFSRPDAGRKTPEDILKERFARGDIDKEEYTQRLAELRK